MTLAQPTSATRACARLKTVALGERLTAFEGRGPGFDHIRIGLSLAILLWHSFGISYGLDYAEKIPSFPVPPLLTALLPMFFGLSGFLVMASALRTDLRTFITFRSLRIVPALFVEITISALVLGPLLTKLPLRDYFTDRTFFEYFGSLVGRVRFALPGVFTDNPAPNLVNFALWTVGPEILCYVIMALMIVRGVHRNRRAVLTITCIYAAVCLAGGMIAPPPRIAEVLPNKALVYSFLVGNCIYLYRDVIPYSRAAAAAAFVAATVLVYIGQQLVMDAPSYLAVPGYIYTVAVLGLTTLPPIPLLHRGDYSYGVYIYGWPIQQSVAYLLPDHRLWWVNFGIALPVVLACAALSWHWIEKPALRLKRSLAGQRHEPWSARTRILVTAAIVLYGVAIIDATSLLPLRPAAKAMLSALGLY